MNPTARSLLDVHAHRPWPIPHRPWVLRQSWHDVLFAHWPVDPRMLRARVPAELQLDLTDHTAWIGVVAFEVTDARIRAVPPLPGLSRFPEVNVRTYVRAGNRPGVYFFSLDAGSLTAVRAARWGLRLPYHLASMNVTRESGRICFAARRDRHHVRARLDVEYSPKGPAFHASKGTLEAFLFERYCLFACDHRRRVYQLEIHHPPWSLQPARAEVQVNTLVDATGITVPLPSSPLLHYAARQDVLAWWPILA
jgi:uncharacterized protein YqjF (DUF2071 family)